MNRDAVFRVLDQFGLSHLRAAASSSVRDSIAIRAEPQDDIRIGASKFGGCPDVPEDFDWPANGDNLLAFLAQIHLSDVAPFDPESLLPHDGLLSFFYDTDENPYGRRGQNAGWRVIYTPVGTPLVRNDRLTGTDSFFPSAVLRFSESVEVGDAFLSHQKDVDPTIIHRLYAEIWPERSGEWAVGHHLLGFPRPIQSSPSQMAAECHHESSGESEPWWLTDRWLMDDMSEASDEDLDAYHGNVAAYYAEKAQDWQLLLQLGSQRNLGWCWGDAGSLYFWMLRDDLASRRFGRAWLICEFY